MKNIVKLSVLQILRGYKWMISPMLPPACRYVPTCSDYAMEAVERYGVMRGGWMGLIRVLRCHPFSRTGYDPVVKKDLGFKVSGFEGRMKQLLKLCNPWALKTYRKRSVE